MAAALLHDAYSILAGGHCLEDLELPRNNKDYLDALGADVKATRPLRLHRAFSKWLAPTSFRPWRAWTC